jgi:hypothetical protein
MVARSEFENVFGDTNILGISGIRASTCLLAELVNAGEIIINLTVLVRSHKYINCCVSFYSKISLAHPIDPLLVRVLNPCTAAAWAASTIRSI